MSSQQLVPEDNADEVTKGQLLECVRGMAARIEKLEEENDDLRELIDKTQDDFASESSITLLISDLVDDKSAIDWSASPDDDQNREVLSDFGRRVSQNETSIKKLQSDVDEVHDGSVDGPTQAWNEIVEAANRLDTHSKHGLPNNRVKLYKENIAQATGKSEKQAGNYIEWFGKEDGRHAKQGTEYVRYQRGSAGNKNAAKKKALIVDLDVWGESDE